MRIDRLMYAALSICLLAAPCRAASADPASGDLSHISVPIRLDLSAAEAAINASVPDRLVDIRENNRVCIAEKRAKYEYPCFRGWKWYSCDGWTRISPDVKCDISGWVNRNGRIELTGSGDTLSISVPIKAKASAEVLGVSETVEAAARVIVHAVPSLDPEWSVRASLRPDLAWDKRPTLRLFNLVDVTIASHVEPKLREQLHVLLAEASEVIGQLDVRSLASSAWESLHNPIPLSSEPPSYLQIHPVSVGFSGLSINEGTLEAVVRLSAQTRVHLGDPSGASVQPSPLPDIEVGPPSQPGFRFVVPVSLPFSEIHAAAEKAFPDGFETTLRDGLIRGDLWLSAPRLVSPGVGRLQLEVDVRFDDRGRFARTVDVFDWFDTEGTFRFVIDPHVDTAASQVAVRNLRLSSETDNELVDTLVQIANLPVIRERIAEMATIDYGSEVADGLALANAALASQELPGIELRGHVDAAGIRNLDVLSDGLQLAVTAEGSLEVEVTELAGRPIQIGMRGL